MHLDPKSLAPLLPKLWADLDVHQYICRELDKHHFDYGTEQVESILLTETCMVLRGMGLDVRLFGWRSADSENADRSINLHTLCFSGEDWGCEGTVGVEELKKRWLRDFFPRQDPTRIQFIRLVDETMEITKADEWLFSFIGPSLRELVVDLEAKSIEDDTPSCNEAPPSPPRL